MSHSLEVLWLPECLSVLKQKQSGSCYRTHVTGLLLSGVVVARKIVKIKITSFEHFNKYNIILEDGK